MLKEPDQLTMLRHRWARSLEVWAAYRTFLHREVEVGPDKVCVSPLLVFQTTHTLLMIYYSFVYSLFDPSGMHFASVSAQLLDHLPGEGREVRKMVLEAWRPLEKPLAIVRNNLGFHGSAKGKGLRHGYDACRDVHPLASEYLMALLRVFFRLTAEVYEPEEPMARPTSHEETLELLDYAREIKEYMDANPKEGFFEQWDVLPTRRAN